MLHITAIQQHLHEACFIALAAEAGLNANALRHDRGVDFSVQRVEQIDGKEIPMGPLVPVQLKATKNWRQVPEGYKVALEAADYNKLALSNPPTLLIVMLLPPDRKQWTEFTDTHTVIRRCCYWTIIRETTTNASSVTVFLPSDHLLTPERLAALVAQYPNL